MRVISTAMKSHKGYIKPATLGLFDTQNRLEQIQDMGGPAVCFGCSHGLDGLPARVGAHPECDAEGPRRAPGLRAVDDVQDSGNPVTLGLSDDQTQFQILDRRSFHHFLGLSEADGVPDQNIIREFREKLTKAELFDALFAAFNQRPTDQGFITRKGQIIDASFVEVPRQRNRLAENAAIKDGALPARWAKDAKRLAHKDVDARWTPKNDVNFYGYKDHVVADLESKLIVRAEVTTASQQDSQALDSLTRPGDPETWADSAYTGQNYEAILARKGIAAHICAKGTRGHELAPGRKRSNRAKSRKLVRLEHIFAFMTGSMRACLLRAS